MAALRSDTPARTVPNSQLIHQLGSPGGFPGSLCLAAGIPLWEGDSSVRGSRHQAAFSADATAHRGPPGAQRWVPAARQRKARSRSPAELRALPPPGRVTGGDTTLPGPGRMGRHHPAATPFTLTLGEPPYRHGAPRGRCPLRPRARWVGEARFAGLRTMQPSPLLEGFLLPRFLGSVFLRSKRAPCLVASRGRRRGGAAVGGCASSAAGRHPAPRQVRVSACAPAALFLRPDESVNGMRLNLATYSHYRHKGAAAS